MTHIGRNFNCTYGPAIISALAFAILFISIIPIGSASSDNFCFGAGCHSEPDSFINSSLFDNSSHRYLQCIDCHVNVTEYPNPTHGDFTNNLTLPLPSSAYNSSDFLLCYGCHMESSLLGLEPDYSNYLWTHNVTPGYPLNISNISTNFINENFSGHNFGNYPANIHWDHLDLHKIDAGAGPDLVWDSNRDSVLDSMVSCPACHDPHGNASGPNLTRGDLGIQHGTDGNGEYGQVTSIEYLRVDGDVYCVGCHGVGVKYYRPYREVLNFSALHISPTNMTTCIQGGCHYSNDLTIEHIEKRNSSCGTCHQSSKPSVIDSIQQGNKTCFSCHSTHAGGSHLTHIEAANGPQISCPDCHNSTSFPLFLDGQNLEGTNVCDECHSPGGAYDGVNDSNIGAKPNWEGVYNSSDDTLKPGKEKWCIGCHDDNPSVVNGETAPNKAGDNSTYGYYLTGHGQVSNYTFMSWQDTSAAGNPGANQTCEGCHNSTSNHIISGPDSGSSRLKSGFENDQNNTNCNQCHTLNGSAMANPQFYTNSTDYEASAHSGKNCTECHEVHGASGAYKAMTRGSEEGLCYQCHTEGEVMNDAISNNRPGGYNSADDIMQAFGKSEKHNLGTSFTINSKTYTLECVSCHNIHIINGKYWDAEDGNKSPVTRFTDNTEVWGDETGEKMDDFVALASGSGGWYYSVARGGSLIINQPAVYQPPKNGSGYEFEFDGDVLPDYTTFCLDCHSNKVVNEVGAINWGQGIGCGYPEPPGPAWANWITCSSPHGLNSANRPSYWGDFGMFGSSGNPDPIFSEPGVTRGRGAGHFMRWPYDSVQKNAGINFVLSCTDCHEAHGSNRGSMIRERFNVNSNGDCGTGGDSDPNGENCADGGNWNSFCNACHYYYGGQHAGMSCGSASCHETNSIHRIKKNTGGGGPYLWTEPSRPSTTPEIQSISGVVGSNYLLVTFTEGVWTNMDQTGALVPGDFLLTDMNTDNPRTITSVNHTPGASFAAITMSAPLIAADNVDLVATLGISIWDSDGEPAGPWPVTISVTPSVVSFQLNESAGNATVTDETGSLTGTVGNPSVALPGDGYFHGNETQNTYIDIDNSKAYLISTSPTGHQRKVTIETRVFVPILDLDTDDINRTATQQRIIERKRSFQLTIFRGDWMTNWTGPEVPRDEARIIFKYRVPSEYRRYCNASAPDDNYVGNGAWWKQVGVNRTEYPILLNHWYKIKVVFDSDRPNIPVNIWVDDQGTDGLGAGENWSGYKNVGVPDPWDSGKCRFQPLPGDEMLAENQLTYIGSPPNHNSLVLFKGWIDWVTWKPVADYSGVDDPPN